MKIVNKDIKPQVLCRLNKNMIEIYAFEYHIDGELYGGTISARSYEHAQELVPFATNIGKLVDEYDVNWQTMIHCDPIYWGKELPIL